jgi:hypothetical protein
VQLQEIIVTSQKRSEDIKDIPISVSAIGGIQLAEHHIADPGADRAADLRDPNRARIHALAGECRREDRANLIGIALEFEVHDDRRHCNDVDGRIVLCRSAPPLLGR